MKKMEYLIYSVEDDQNIARIIRMSLSKQGYQVESFAKGASFRKAMSLARPDMILLDLMLPDCDGMSLLQEVRNDPANEDIEILIVSAKSQLMDKVDGLDLGADDYIEKPFDLLELISRVNARARRKIRSSSIRIGGTEINQRTRRCLVEGKEIHLTNMEFGLLYALMSSAGRALTRDFLLQSATGEESVSESRTIDVHINSIRKKLGAEGNRIQSIYGIGYRFKDDE